MVGEVWRAGWQVCGGGVVEWGEVEYDEMRVLRCVMLWCEMW